jgi:hypothetical protein
MCDCGSSLLLAEALHTLRGRHVGVDRRLTE